MLKMLARKFWIRQDIDFRIYDHSRLHTRRLVIDKIKQSRRDFADLMRAVNRPGKIFGMAPPSSRRLFSETQSPARACRDLNGSFMVEGPSSSTPIHTIDREASVPRSTVNILSRDERLAQSLSALDPDRDFQFFPNSDRLVFARFDKLRHVRDELELDALRAVMESC